MGYIVEAMSSEFYNLKCENKDGDEIDFNQFRGTVVLIVNVASRCGFRNQYIELQHIFEDYKDQKFTILAFPCNQFLNQEPGTDEEIGKFCQEFYGVNFHIMKKCKVNGRDASPIYQYLKSQKPGLLGFTLVKWNFEKFLIDRSGSVYERYSTIFKPENIRKDIEKLLREDITT